MRRGFTSTSIAMNASSESGCGIRSRKRWRRFARLSWTTPRLGAGVRDGRAFRAVFDFGGSALKRAPRGFPADHPCIEDLKRKDFIGVASMEPAVATSAKLGEEMAAMFAAGRGFMGFLCGALGLPF